jgi:RNA polymerase sigma-70 factor, ECF subfamily
VPGEERHLLSDDEALRRAADGDGSAFEAVVDRHGAAVLRYLHALTDDADSAEDAFQEAFLAAWRSAGSFRGGDSARPWLLTIARHALHRQHRRAAAAPPRFESLGESLESLALEAGWGEAADRLDRRLDARETVAAGFAGLSPEDREILVLRDLEGCSGEEVAEMLGLSLAAVKSRLHRARLRFVGNLKGGRHGP